MMTLNQKVMDELGDVRFSSYRDGLVFRAWRYGYGIARSIRESGSRAPAGWMRRETAQEMVKQLLEIWNDRDMFMKLLKRCIAQKESLSELLLQIAGARAVRYLGDVYSIKFPFSWKSIYFVSPETAMSEPVSKWYRYWHKLDVSAGSIDISKVGADVRALEYKVYSSDRDFDEYPGGGKRRYLLLHCWGIYGFEMLSVDEVEEQGREKALADDRPVCQLLLEVYRAEIKAIVEETVRDAGIVGDLAGRIFLAVWPWLWGNSTYSETRKSLQRLGLSFRRALNLMRSIKIRIAQYLERESLKSS
mgnify:CR=1 FL=1